MTMDAHDSGKSDYDRGTDHYFAKQYQEAIDALTTAIERSPDNYRAYDRRGSAYKSLKLYDRALSDYNRALELNPQFENAYRNRGHVFRHTNLLRSAIADFETAKRHTQDQRHKDMIDKFIQGVQDRLDGA